MLCRDVSLLCALAAAGCGAAPATAVETGAGERPAAQAAERLVPTIESEVGAMDEGKVAQAFARSASGLAACWRRGTERLPYLAGRVSFKLRIDRGGMARTAYLSDSTLGDRATEACMLGVLKAASWPSPQGGSEGLAGNDGMVFDPDANERPPIEWSADRVSDAMARVMPALSSCRSKTGTGAMKATMYIDTDGKAKSVGVSVSDAKGEDAVPCVVRTLSGATFPTPGSWVAKVSVAID